MPTTDMSVDRSLDVNVLENGGGGNRTPGLTFLESNAYDTETVQNRTNTKQNKTLSKAPSPVNEQKQTHSEHEESTSLHKKCATCVQQNLELPGDLAQVVEAWDSLPDVVKAGITAMVNAASQQ